ncbi:MAG: hypothetical protein F6K19_01600 [Cyanothece sp. SIO1E1]|nr:hypothetical protein [Cyanothece sp. SIO1E1]
MKAISSNIHLIDLPKGKSEQNFLFISDIHYDSRKCLRKLLKKHLDEAMEREAYIHINGDVFDVMGAKRDPRSIPNDIRPEYNITGVDYFDVVVEDAYGFLKPYKDRLFMNFGNHETSQIKRQQTNPLRRLAIALYGMEDYQDHLGAYTGFVGVKFKDSHGGRVRLSKVNYHHSIGNGKRSMGVLDVQMNAMRYPDADIIVRGDIHKKWCIPTNFGMYLNSHTMEAQRKMQRHICTSSYKGEDTDGFGWATEKMFDAHPPGGYFCKMVHKKEISYHFEEAQ